MLNSRINFLYMLVDKKVSGRKVNLSQYRTCFFKKEIIWLLSKLSLQYCNCYLKILLNWVIFDITIAINRIQRNSEN